MNNIASIISKIFFKNSCVVCNEKLNREYHSICKKCFENIRLSSSLKEKNGIYYIWNYKKTIRELLINYKFKHNKKNHEILSIIIKEKIKYLIDLEKIDIIIPVPLHIKRKNERGFSHLEEIFKFLKIDYIKLKRNKNIKKMATLHSVKDRQENIKGSFLIDKNLKLNGKNILIFDDILTTGTTLFELKNELIKVYRPNKVIFFTLTITDRYLFSKWRC